MKATNTYLDVPFAQKDAAKALGAKWDPLKKKWFAPADKELALFSQWLPANPVDDQPGVSVSAAPQSSSARDNKKPADVPVRTYPLDKNFQAYDGLEPPWAL